MGGIDEEIMTEAIARIQVSLNYLIFDTCPMKFPNKPRWTSHKSVFQYIPTKFVVHLDQHHTIDGIGYKS